MDSQNDHINVSVRIKPILDQESSSDSSLQVLSKEPPVLLMVDRGQIYHFDNIFSEDADQEKVFMDAVKPFVDHVKKGYNCTVFAYGQTGTGKTYTMGSAAQKPKNRQHIGIIPRALEQLFNDDQLNSEEEIEVFVSFSEIYNEKVFDLLQPTKKTPLPVSGLVVQGLSLRNVKSVAEAKELLETGNKSRHTGETKQNVNSSRSHAIFTVHFTLRNSLKEVTGKLNLVDLAGSESVRKTGSKGSTFQEGININKGLLSIGQVISALSMKYTYIPYRQSMITSILQGSLNVDNYISLIACVSANPDDTTETLQTLDFAQRAKRIRSNPEVNQLISKYRKENTVAFGSARKPVKRANNTPMKTPAVKRTALPLLPLINESTGSQISNVDSSSKSQFSINISSVSSRISPGDINQQNFSPVLRKYMTRMEESIMDRLETVIRTTLRRPTRASLRTEKSINEKENTPKMRWSKIQTEVSKMVQSEIAQMSAKTVRATSSPIEDKEPPLARKLLIYDSPDSMDGSCMEPAKPTNKDQPQRNFSFKVPLPVEGKKSRRPTNISISPIENEMPTSVAPRKSLRLSLKRANTSVNNTHICGQCEVSFDSHVTDRLAKPVCNTSVDVNSPLNQSARKEMGKFSVPRPKIVEKLSKHVANVDSPYTSHGKKVLRILNMGSQKELEKLVSVGTKTAEQIMLYRKLKGKFNRIEDISNVPGWGPKRFEKFVTTNFLRKD